MFKLFSSKDISDEDLVKKYAQSGNLNLLSTLYQRYTHLVFAVAMKYLKHEQEAEDVVMDIFEKLAVDLRKHEIDNFKGWLHTTVRNFCLMKLRKEKNFYSNQKTLQKDYVEKELSNHQEEQEERNLLEMNLEKLGTALHQLKDEQKICVQLFYLEGLSYQEVTDKTGFDYKTVKSHLQNGRRNLQNILQK